MVCHKKAACKHLQAAFLLFEDILDTRMLT